jgi:hypothetical protein
MATCFGGGRKVATSAFGPESGPESGEEGLGSLTPA